MNQTCQTGISVDEIPLLSGGLRARPPQDPKSARRDLSMKHSITACAFLLGYIAIYMCVGFAAVALVARAWLAVFE